MTIPTGSPNLHGSLCGQPDHALRRRKILAASRHAVASACALLVLAGCSTGSQLSGVKPMLADAFGKVLKVEGVVSDGSQTKAKGEEGIQLLTIISINDAKMAKPVMLQVQWLTGDAQLPLGHVVLVGYESGAFSGVPHEGLEHLRVSVSATDFGFMHCFVAVKDVPSDGKQSHEHGVFEEPRTHEAP